MLKAFWIHGFNANLKSIEQVRAFEKQQLESKNKIINLSLNNQRKNTQMALQTARERNENAGSRWKPWERSEKLLLSV